MIANELLNIYDTLDYLSEKNGARFSEQILEDLCNTDVLTPIFLFSGYVGYPIDENSVRYEKMKGYFTLDDLFMHQTTNRKSYPPEADVMCHEWIEVHSPFTIYKILKNQTSEYQVGDEVFLFNSPPTDINKADDYKYTHIEFDDIRFIRSELDKLFKENEDSSQDYGDKDSDYYAKFNNCENISANFDYFTILEAALVWCGMTSDEIKHEIKHCKPKSDKNEQTRNTYIHPYIPCVELRCTVLHEAFNNNKLKMGRDGDVSGFKEATNNPNDIIVGHISPSRRTIKVIDLKEYIKTYHPDDMPKTLFTDIDISKTSPITHEDYLSLKAKNEALEIKLENAKCVLVEKSEEIANLRQNVSQPTNDKELSHKSQMAVSRLLYTLLTEHNYDLSATKGLTNDLIVKASEIHGTPVTRNFVASWIELANQAKSDSTK